MVLAAYEAQCEHATELLYPCGSLGGRQGPCQHVHRVWPAAAQPAEQGRVCSSAGQNGARNGGLCPGPRGLINTHKWICGSLLQTVFRKRVRTVCKSFQVEIMLRTDTISTGWCSQPAACGGYTQGRYFSAGWLRPRVRTVENGAK